MVRLALTIAAGLAMALLLDDLTAFPGPLPGFERIGQDMIGATTWRLIGATI